MSYNPLILPSTGHAGNFGDAQLQFMGTRKSSCLDLLKDLVLGRLSCLSLLGYLPVQWSQEVNMPQPAQGPSTGLGIQSPGDCHASACLGICTLTRGCLALRLQECWVR